MSAQVTSHPTCGGLLDEVRQRRRVPEHAQLRAYREAAGVTQERLARELGVHPVTVARWEAGTRTPRGPMRDRYLDLLDDLREAIHG